MGSAVMCCYKQGRVLVNGLLENKHNEDTTEGEVVQRQIQKTSVCGVSIVDL